VYVFLVSVVAAGVLFATLYVFLNLTMKQQLMKMTKREALRDSMISHMLSSRNISAEDRGVLEGYVTLSKITGTQRQQHT